MMQAIVEKVGEAIAATMDWDVFWFTHHYRVGDKTCIRCNRAYKHRGWLMRHYKKTGHWKQGA